MLTFLEIVLALTFIYLISQVLLPLWLPGEFKINWLFRKRTTLKEKVEGVAAQKKALRREAKSLKSKTEQNLKQAKDMAEKLKN